MNQSVTQYTPPHQTPGSKYTVTVQGLTATGAGAASVLEFESYVSGNGCSALGLAEVASLGVIAEPGATSRAVSAPTPLPPRVRQVVWALWDLDSAVGATGLGESCFDGVHCLVPRAAASLQPMVVPVRAVLAPLLFH